MAGGGIIVIGTTLIPLLSGLFLRRRPIDFLTDWLTGWLEELVICGLNGDL